MGAMPPWLRERERERERETGCWRLMVEGGGAEKAKARMLRWGVTRGGVKNSDFKSGSCGRQKFGHFAS